MKKIVYAFLAVVLMYAVSNSAFAEEAQQGRMGKKGSMMGDKHKMMKHCMMNMMSGSGLVATKDGGVIVMRGNKLFKYDKDLNLKKEVDIKMDFESMQKMMTEMKEKCPMYKMMKQGEEEAAVSEGQEEDPTQE